MPVLTFSPVSLTERVPHVEVPLLVTLGSLGIDVVKSYLPRPMGRPPSVAHWLNGTDERDPVALYSRLDRDTFPAVIEEAALAVRAPRRRVVTHGIVVVGSCLSGTADQGVRVIDEYFYPCCGATEHRWAFPTIVLGLRDEERRTLKLQAND